MTTAIPAVTQSGQQVLILREGSTKSTGREAQKNNIAAAKLVAELVRSCLGPRGMDKMLVDTLGDITITDDGATILKELDVNHPAAKAIIEISKVTDSEVGDGTTSAVVLAGALLERAEELLDKGVHPMIIVDGYKKAEAKAKEILNSVAIKVDAKDKDWLTKVAKTSIATKMISLEGDYMASLAVESLLSVVEEYDGKIRVDIDNVKVEKKAGGSTRDTQLIHGIALDKEVVHSGMPKSISEAKIALINSPLEIEKTEYDTKITINNPEQIKMFLDEENMILKNMVNNVIKTGANVLICQKGIDDVAQQYLAKAGILSVRRVSESDMNRLAKATGGKVVTIIEQINSSDLGNAKHIEERKIEDGKWVFVEGCKDPKAVTLFLRGGTQRVVEESVRSIHDALCVVRDVMLKPSIVLGAGAPEAEIASKLFDYAQTLSGREQLAVRIFAEALESITITLAENAGLDPINILSELRSRHEKGETWAGIEVNQGTVQDMTKAGVFEPLAVKKQIIKSANEAASMILKIDDVIASGKSRAPPMPPGGMGGGMGGMGGYPGAGEY